MKLNTNNWGYIYLNRNKWTRNTYLNETFPSKEQAAIALELDRPYLKKSRKNIKLVRVTLETVE